MASRPFDPSMTWPRALVALGAVLALAGTLRAEDPNSLQVKKDPPSCAPGEVLVSWTDATPSVYCLEKDSTLPLSGLDREDVDTLESCEDPGAPPNGVWYFKVEEGSCGGGPALCTASGQELDCSSGTVGGDTGDPAATDAVSDYPGCGATGLTGREYAYTFVPTQTQEVTLTLRNAPPDLRLLVIHDTGTGCDPASCVTADPVSVTFAAGANETYYVVVDGPAGASEPFDLQVDCRPVSSETCLPQGGLVCGNPQIGNNRNTNPDTTTNIDLYPCSGFDESAPEYTYSFRPDRSGQVTLSANSSSSLDIFVLDGETGVCNQDGCIAGGDSQTVFQATANKLYYVVVDGRDGSQGSYSLNVACDFPPAECMPAYPLRCGDLHFWNNGGSGSTDAIDSRPCAAGDYSGPEYVYQFIPDNPNEAVQVRATLQNQTADQDLFVIRNYGNGCEAAGCEGSGDTEVDFEVGAGESFYIGVDGKNGAVGDYRIFVECFPVPDPCVPAGTLSCGDSLTGQSNDQAGSTRVVDIYPDCKILDPLDESGPEYVYTFVSTKDQDVTVHLTNISGGTPHVYVLEDMGQGCLAQDCVAWDPQFDGTVTFHATVNTTYYIAVDGFQGSVGSYHIQLSCP